MVPEEQQTPQPEEDRPPIFRTWRRLYAVVVAYLALLILLFYAFTKAYQLPP